MALSAHLWTVASRLRPAVEAPEARALAVPLDDPAIGRVQLSGFLREEPDAGGVLVFVHGIGGCATAPYAHLVARAAAAAGLSCLRVNLRGCDRASNDYYHAGLASDLAALIGALDPRPDLRLYLLGYSLGGHLALRYAAGEPDPRLAAVAAVCSPLDLAPAAAALDRPALWAYRRFVLGNLKEIYAAVAARRSVPLPVEEATKLVHIREWDERVVAPRWGFAGADDYYARASVAPHLGRLAVPALLVAAQGDPLVPAEVLSPTLARAGSALEVRWVKGGGHVGFPADLELGERAPRGLEGQVLGWLTRSGELGGGRPKGGWG